MVTERKSQFVAIPIDEFRKALRDIPFDIYIKLSDENYAHVFSKSTGLDYQRLAQYRRKGTTHLYVNEKEHEAFKKHIANHFDNVLSDPQIPQTRKVAALLNMTEQNLAEIFCQYSVKEETGEMTKEVVQNYIKNLGSDPTSLSIILRLVSHGDYLYYHSIATAVFSLFIAKATGQFNRDMLEHVGLGGFLHDIGCTKVSEEIMQSPHELTSDQWQQMKEHTRLGIQMIEDTKSISDEARYIIYQHHEHVDGSGYPNGLRGNAIYYPAKIVCIADAFSAMVSQRPFRPAFSINETLEIMRKKTGQFDRDLVDIAASLFADELDVKKTA